MKMVGFIIQPFRGGLGPREGSPDLRIEDQSGDSGSQIGPGIVRTGENLYPEYRVIAMSETEHGCEMSSMEPTYRADRDAGDPAAWCSRNSITWRPGRSRDRLIGAWTRLSE